MNILARIRLLRLLRKGIVAGYGEGLNGKLYIFVRDPSHVEYIKHLFPEADVQVAEFRLL